MVVTALLVMKEDEDRRKIASKLIDRGFRIAEAQDAETAAIILNENSSIILTLAEFSLEKEYHFPICKTARGSSHKTFVLLFGCETGEDELLCFRHGADDCVREPFDQSLLLMRIDKLTRPEGANEQGDIVLGGIRISPREHLVEIDNQPVMLTQKEFDLLYYFLVNRNLALSREQILFFVWDADYDGGERIVDSFVKSLRDKLGPYRKNLCTVRNVGYKFEWRIAQTA